MKSTCLILMVVLLCSCGAQKKVAETTQKETPQVITETPKKPKTPEVPVVETPKVTPPVVETKIETPVSTPIKNDETVTTAPKLEAPKATPVPEPKTAFNHSSWNELLERYVSTQGNVNYKGFKTNRTALKNYITALSENIPNSEWSKSEKMAYWINAYNALTVDLILRHYPIKSIKDIKDPWDQRFWKLGEKWYNLNEIEHDILRKMDDARIHFAIVCASYSCPKLENTAFTANNLDLQLNIATKAFLMDKERNVIAENNIKLSKIFKWFAGDFKTNGTLIDFLNKHSDIKISSNAKKSFLDYDWNLNQ